MENEGWHYLPGNSIVRNSKTEVLYEDDQEQFISNTNPDLTPEEVRQIQIIDIVRLVGAESDFESPANNIFRAVNRFAVEYTNNGQTEKRRPDVLPFVNGMPLCVIELKKTADTNATIYDAWEQINIQCWRDIPHLLHYFPLVCISDGVKARLGTVRTPYEHFYAWRRVNNEDKVSTLPFEEMETMIKGGLQPTKILGNLIYFQDREYDDNERDVVCRYPQFFAARMSRKLV